MKTKQNKKTVVCLMIVFGIISFIFCVIIVNHQAPIKAHANASTEALSQMSEQECLNFIAENNIAIPESFLENPWFGSICT